MTSHEECIKEAFGKNVLGFIEKRDLKKELPDILRHLYQDILRRESVWEIEERRIPIDQIYCVLSEGVYVRVITEKEEYLFRMSLSECEKQLEKWGFMRVHRSALIYLKYVTGVTEHEVEIKKIGKIKISRGMCRKIKSAYMEFTRREGGR